IRDRNVTGVQTCALPICRPPSALPVQASARLEISRMAGSRLPAAGNTAKQAAAMYLTAGSRHRTANGITSGQIQSCLLTQQPLKIGRASCREREKIEVVE